VVWVLDIKDWPNGKFMTESRNNYRMSLGESSENPKTGLQFRLTKVVNVTTTYC